MKNWFTYVLFILSPLLGTAQLIPASTDDQLGQLISQTGRTAPETAVLVGKNLLGLPYVPHTLDQQPTEQLVVNLREFDCTTYLETVLALTLAWHDNRDRAIGSRAVTPAACSALFRQYLTRLRYRDGRIDGYVSRLHYFSDWLRDNERKGFLADVTATLPGRVMVSKPVNYMTSAVYKYPPLSDPAVLDQMIRVESALNGQPFAFVPKKNVRLAETALHDGDIVMLTAARPGLDMKHVGLAVRQPSGRMHLLHASSDAGRVVVSSTPIADYVLNHPRLSGLRVARLRPDQVLTADRYHTGFSR
ncbi:N-acetylmuramoyl-L-alanine amidase-like domain-containing protein [Spirosoma rhododendri]|uniref:DUF1460 domain-containing protein n=1 Tax=Spirosoma rhododendri TaxID=2728024 RepID=A0A7L5DTC9_9BACT|nr:N-acetylmuramoyl-L-alanine amidase-like domain-containing protein [Spirosoma rhododendri]QJD79858.1 DUF1460 domain-containing protein [Spirosoma rhododendri]